MRKRAKLTYLIYLVLVLVLAGNVSEAVYYEWDGGGPNTVWNEPLNWNPDAVPTVADFATLDIPDANCLIDSNVAAETVLLTVSDTNNGPCYLNMTGGTLFARAGFRIGDDNNSVGTFTMSGGTVETQGRLWVGADGNGTFIMTGGEFNVTTSGGTKLELGKDSSATGYMYMSGGTLNLSGSSCDFEIGKHGHATFVMTGGDVNVVDNVKLAEGGEGSATIHIVDGNIYSSGLKLGKAETAADANATIYLEGGDVNTSDIDIYAEKGLIDINEGTLVVRDSDELTCEIIYNYVSEGQIIGYHGEGIVDVNVGDDIIITARIGDPNLARTPNPGRYATVPWTPAGPNLAWAPGKYADNHDVYFGTDEPNVTDANNTPGVWTEFLGNKDPCNIPFPSPPPVLGETYYWRIDANNDPCAAAPWKGDVWQFMMENYVVVEDFESYASTDDLNDTWILTGSDISLETTIVQPKSDKSMQYDFNNADSPYYTEADANTIGPNSLPIAATVGRDWTTADIKALVVNFYGDVNTAAEPMYVALKDTDGNTAVVYYDDSNDLNEPEWHEWNIKLNDFNDINDVNLSSIDKLYIGFGNRETPVAGGAGTVYFDDIRLYPTRCVALFAPAGDIDGDCEVDLDDFSEMAGDWREKDATRAGSDADVNGGTWVDDGAGGTQRGRCVELDGIDDWVDLDDSDFIDFHNKTIAFWVKVISFADISRYMFHFDDEGDPSYRIGFMTHDPDVGAVRVRFLQDYTTSFDAASIWRHLAFVLEDTPNGLCTGKFYVDGGDGFTPGVPYDTMPDRRRHSGAADGVNIGSDSDGTTKFVNARIDDFRVYARALSGGEIAALYNATKALNPSGTAPDANMLVHYKFDETAGLIADNNSTYAFYHPLLSDAELYDGEAVNSREVNFRDLAILVDDWLEEKLWP